MTHRVDDVDALSADTVSHHLRQMMAMEGWAILVRKLYLQREQIISKGKNSRENEDRIQMWAALEGFDTAALLAEKMVKAAEVVEAATSAGEED